MKTQLTKLICGLVLISTGLAASADNHFRIIYLHDSKTPGAAFDACLAAGFGQPELIEKMNINAAANGVRDEDAKRNILGLYAQYAQANRATATLDQDHFMVLRVSCNQVLRRELIPSEGQGVDGSY